MSKPIRILFLGASKRVSLMERFINSGNDLGINLELFSCEISNDFYPISHLAKITRGPLFTDEKFAEWLKNYVYENAINIIIPNMDSATVALSKVSETMSISAKCVVSDHVLCKSMEDKNLSQEYFIKLDLPIPPNTADYFPKIAKPSRGYGSKGITKLESKKDADYFFSKNNASDYTVQDFIEGRETTVDIYISRIYGSYGYVLRDRIEVSDGEVMVCKTRIASKRERDLLDKIINISGWEGCITVQYLTNNSGIYLCEINPRFGGGATCGIEAGLDMPKYILQEYMGKKPSQPKKIRNILMTRARRDYFYEQ